MTVYRYIGAGTIAALIGIAASAQDGETFSGHVVSTDNSGSALVVQLDVENNCGSFTYSANTQEFIDVTQGALDAASQHDPGILTLRVEGCAAGSAVIIGAAGGPDLGFSF